jgi:nucleoside-diphosphate-sugar epimerase
MTTPTTQQNKKPTLLVTGSEGSLAQWIIGLLKDDFFIVGVDNFNRYGVIERARDYKFYQLDLTDSTVIGQVFVDQQIDYVLHCAAQIYGVKGFHKYPADILSNNLVSTSNVLQQCVQHSVKKIIYISSSMVYENCQTFPLKEEYTKNIALPTTGYGLSKLVGEKLVEEFHRQYNLKYVIWRPFNIVTPLEVGEDEPGIAHVMADFIQKIVIDKDNPVEIFGDGNQTRCFTNIADIANIISKKSFDVDTDNQVFNVGSETPTKIIDLAKMIHKISGRQDIFSAKFVDIYSDDVKYRVPDCTKAKHIGWKHTKSIEELINICISNGS